MDTPLALSDVIARIERDGGSVVGIAAHVVRRQPTRDADTQWLSQFFPRAQPFPDSREPVALQNLGAGIVISSDGLILANAHVVADAFEVSVRLPGRERSYPASVIGIDRTTDVALLRIDAVGLRVVSVGRSERLRVGEWVAAVASSQELPHIASTGVVGVRERGLDEPFVAFIRTDAVSAPSASGPLMNAKGEVVGISSGVVGRGVGQRNTALAVPIEVALDIAHQLRVHGEMRRAHLGIRVETITPTLAEVMEFPYDTGLRVAAVMSGGPADRAGVAAGDVILQVNGVRIRSPLDFSRRAVDMKPGASVTLRLWRRGSVRDVVATLENERKSTYRS
ncbi:MAG TPA: trypsin-like peptidase domain-containing protein [Burkholderiales bacterium]|nr:trypsin-like peptidase domain-containing protein [Burkholderiales bacterium]